MHNYLRDPKGHFPAYRLALGHDISLPHWKMYFNMTATYYTGPDFRHRFPTDFHSAYAHLYAHRSAISLPEKQQLLANTLHALARKIMYSTFVMRIDHAFTRYLYTTGKLWYESSTMGFRFRHSFYKDVSFLLGVEYQPFPKQNMRLFSYYFRRHESYYDLPASSKPKSMLSVGVLWLLRAL